jgi:hypothetical protein
MCAAVTVRLVNYYCGEIRCQDTTSEDREPYYVCNVEL